MWIQLARVSGYMGATLVMCMGGTLFGFGCLPPWKLWHMWLLVLGVYVVVAGWVFLGAALKIGKPLPGNRDALPKHWRPAPRVMVPCDVCIQTHAVLFCRSHHLYACLSCTNNHDRPGCTYEPLPIGGMVCH